MLRRVSTSFAAQIWALFVNLADRVILVGILLRVWGTDVYADWATILAAANLISMGELGLNVYLGNAWQRAFAHKNEAEFQRLLSVSLSLYLVLGFSLMIIAAGLAFTTGLSGQLPLQVIKGDIALQVFLILAAAFAIRVMRGSISQVYRGRGHFAAGTMIGSLSTAALIASVVIAASAGAGPVHIALVYLLIDAIFGLAIVIFDLRRRHPHLQFRPAFATRPELSDMVRHGKWYAILQAAPVAWLRLPVLIISGLGLGGLAIVSFVVLRTLTNFARQIPEMLARSVGVETAGEFHLGDSDRLGEIYFAFGPFLCALTGAFAGALPLFAPSILVLWTGNADTYNLWTILWLLVPVALIAPATPFRNTLTLGNLPGPVAIAHLVQLALGLPLCYLLAQSHGIQGAAAGLAVGDVLALGVLLPVLARHQINTNYRAYFTKCVVCLALAAIWSAILASLLIGFIGSASLTGLLFGMLIWTLAGLLPAMFFAIPPVHRSRLLRRGTTT